MTLFDPEYTARLKTAVNTMESELRNVYRERAHLVGFLTTLFPSHFGHTDPSTPDYGVATVDTPAGQMAWHIHNDDADVIPAQATNTDVIAYDGHSTEEKYARLRDLTAQMDETHTPEPEPEPTPPGGAAAPAPEHDPAPQVPAPTEPAPADDDEKSAA